VLELDGLVLIAIGLAPQPMRRASYCYFFGPQQGRESKKAR
jgi:hypothetical protein